MNPEHVAGAEWTFTDAVQPERVARLLSVRSFREVIAQVAVGLVAPLYWEPATTPHLKGCCRASFDLVVSPEAYDAFFNSPAGYRGMYAISEGRGESANRELISALRSKLLAAAVGHGSTGQLDVAASLNGEQAKVWIVESEVEEQLSSPQSISFPEWEFNEPDGQGLRAPVGSQLEIKGAWLDQSRSVVFNESKRWRSRNIYRTGDSK